MDGRDGVESFSKTLGKARPDVRIKGRPHQQVDHHQIQDQDNSLAKPVRQETLVPSQERAKYQSDAHRNLNRKIQIRVVASMSAEKTVHSAHFLIRAQPLRRSRRPISLQDFCLVFFRQEIRRLSNRRTPQHGCYRQARRPQRASRACWQPFPGARQRRKWDLQNLESSS